MPNTKRTVMLLIIIFSTWILSACWDNRDLAQLGLAAAVGLDKASNGDIEVTVQLVKPSVIKAKGQGSEEETVWVYSAKGKTVFAAVRNLLSTVNRKVYFAHAELIIIGEELARDYGVAKVLDLFERDHETKRVANILIAKNITAKQILQAKSDLETIPAMHIISIMENNIAVAKTRKIQLIEILRFLNSKAHSTPVGVIQKTEETQNQDNQDNVLEIRDLEVQGTAILKKDTLIGWLGPMETRGFLFALNEVESSIIEVENPKDKGQTVAFEIFKSVGKIDVELKNDNPKLIIEISAEGTIGDQQGGGNLTTPETLSVMKQEIEKVILKEIYSALDKAQDTFKIDFYGFSSIVHEKYKDYWKDHKDNWDQIFSHSPVEVKVKWATEGSGLIRNTSQPK